MTNICLPPRKSAEKHWWNTRFPSISKTWKRDLAKYRIHYDRWFKESSLHADGSVDKVIKLLKEKGHTYEAEGATWFKATEFGADKDFVLVRSNGFPTYIVPDIAYHYDKLVTRGYDKAINVLGADHHGYVARMKAALQAIGIDPSRLDVVLMQMVNLVRDGQIIKASKRSGKAITLVTLLEEIPVDAARFYFNLREAQLPVRLRPGFGGRAVQSEPGILCSVRPRPDLLHRRQNLKSEGIEPRDVTLEELDLLVAPEEIELIRHLAKLPNGDR